MLGSGTGTITGAGNFAVAIGSPANSSENSVAIGGLASALAAGTIAIGRQTLTGPGVDSIAIGDQTQTGGEANIVIGARAVNQTNTGADNIVIGPDAALALTTGASNVVIGTDAAPANTTGSNAVVVGDGAATTATAIDDTVVIGAGAADAATTIGAGSVVIGFDAAGSATSVGIETTAIGRQALNNSTGGTGNTAVGSQAGANISTGADNILIGRQAGATTLTTGSGNIVIGVTIDTPAAGTSNYVTLGDRFVSDGTTTDMRVSGVVGIAVDSSSDIGAANPGDVAVVSASNTIEYVSASTISSSKTTIPVTGASPASDPAPTAAALEAQEITYIANTSANVQQITLPNPPPANGTIVRVKDNGNGNTNNVSIVSAANIDGSSPAVIAANYGSLTLQSDGSTYWVI